MARADIISRMMCRDQSALTFDWDSLVAPPLLSILSPYDIQILEDVVRDPRLNSKILKKREIIDQILTARGLKRFASGTNRIVYKHLEDQSIVLKTAISEAGIEDSPREYKNQFKIQPFVTKCFETSPNGAVGLFERVDPITSKEQYFSISDEIYELIDNIIGRFVMADIGTKFFMNIGVRKGFGPVFLDYPMLFELDGSKLYCNVVNPFTGIPCGGQIDYDPGFNFLHCTCCGKQYLASSLEKGDLGKNIIMKGRKETTKMKIQVFKNDEVIKETQSVISTEVYMDNMRREKEVKENRKMKVTVSKPVLTPAFDELSEEELILKRQQATDKLYADVLAREKEAAAAAAKDAELATKKAEADAKRAELIRKDREIREKADAAKAKEAKEKDQQPNKVVPKASAPYAMPDPSKVQAGYDSDKAILPTVPTTSMDMNMEEDTVLEEVNEVHEDAVIPIPVGAASIVEEKEEVTYKVLRRGEKSSTENYSDI